ncbi:MAG TPA: PAS domain-containing protein [Actinomycetes bacterium]
MEDPFTRELRAARARIAELQRRHGAAAGPARRLLPEALAEVDTALEELAVTGQELQAQTAELAATREALESERARYQELFQSAPVAYLVTDPLGRIREANRAAASLLLRCRGGEVAAAQVTVTAVRDRAGAVRALRWLVRDTAAPDGPEPLLVVSVDQAIRQEAARRRQLEALADLDPVEDLDGTVQLVLDAGTRLVRVDATARADGLVRRPGRRPSLGAAAAGRRR